MVKAGRGIINHKEKERRDVNSVLLPTRYKSAEHENARIYMLRRPRRREKKIEHDIIRRAKRGRGRVLDFLE